MLSLVLSWKKKKPQFTKVYVDSDIVEAKKSHLIKELPGKTPVNCFNILFDDKIVIHIGQPAKTLAYSKQKNNHKFELSNDCIRKFF